MEKYGRNEQMIDGELDNEQVILHLEKGKYFGLNPLGKRIWELIREPKSFQDLVGILLSEFEVTDEQCAKEVQAFLDKTIKYGIVLKL